MLGYSKDAVLKLNSPLALTVLTRTSFSRSFTSRVLCPAFSSSRYSLVSLEVKDMVDVIDVGCQNGRNSLRNEKKKE